MNQLKLTVHSFIDLITNSSTEIYVSAHDKTIRAAKAMVNKVLAAAGAAQTADDLFDFALTVTVTNEKTWKESEVDVKSPEGKEALENQEQPELHLLVTAKADSPDANAAAKALSELSELFNAEEKYC